MQTIVDAIRKVTAAMQTAIDSGQRSRQIDADDLIQVLLAIADDLDPPFGAPVRTEDACPGCGEARSDRLIWQDDERVRCATCEMEYIPAGRHNCAPPTPHARHVGAFSRGWRRLLNTPTGRHVGQRGRGGAEPGE